MASGRLNLPNSITAARIVACPAIFLLAFSSTSTGGLGAFGLFTLASVSDLWDGYLARKHGLVTDLGKLLDPLADKLLLLATLVPFYVLSHRAGGLWHLPWWGPFPLWVLVLMLGRELAITLFRAYAAGRGVVIAAGRSGKYKAFVQSLFSGGLLLWYPLKMMAASQGWDGAWWAAWSGFHGAWIGITLAAAVLLTVYSLGDYLWAYRYLLRGHR